MPRQGLAIDISTLAGSEGVVTTIDDFFFESFSAGEMHPMLTTSRTNLVLQSETWNNASWTKNASTVEANQIASPLDLSAFTADLLKEDNTNAEHWVRSNNITASLGQTFTMSFYAKAKERTFIKANFLNSGVVSYNVWINLSNGAITSKNANLTVTTELIGSGFYRITLTAQAAATTLNLLVALATGDANNSYAGDGSSGAYVFGAQVEQDNFVSNYIPTVGSTVSVSTTLNDTSEVWDFDGTDIMLAEDPEDEGFWEEGSNLVLNHDFADLGSEEVTNGNFATDSDWTLTSDFSITNGKLHCLSTGSYQYALQGGVFVVGKTYKVTFSIVEYNSGAIRVRPSGQSPFTSYSAAGTYTQYFTATDSTLVIERTGSCDLFVDNISVKQVDPNDRWSLGTGWTISDGKAHADTSGTAALSQTISTGAGNTYEVTFTISNFTTGVLQPQFDGILATPTQINSNGTHTVKITAAGSSHGLLLYAIGTSEFTIDNVTIKEYAIKPKDI